MKIKRKEEEMLRTHMRDICGPSPRGVSDDSPPEARGGEAARWFGARVFPSRVLRADPAAGQGPQRAAYAAKNSRLRLLHQLQHERH